MISNVTCEILSKIFEAEILFLLGLLISVVEQLRTKRKCCNLLKAVQQNISISINHIIPFALLKIAEKLKGAGILKQYSNLKSRPTAEQGTQHFFHLSASEKIDIKWKCLFHGFCKDLTENNMRTCRAQKSY